MPLLLPFPPDPQYRSDTLITEVSLSLSLEPHWEYWREGFKGPYLSVLHSIPMIIQQGLDAVMVGEGACAGVELNGWYGEVRR